MSTHGSVTTAPRAAGRAEPTPVAPEVRLERAVRATAYMAAGLPLGLAYFALIGAGLLLGGALTLVWIGFPLLQGTEVAIRHFARLERTLANRLLGARIPPLPAREVGPGGSAWQRVREGLGGAAFWRAMGLLALRLPTSLLAVAGVGAGVALTFALLALGVRGLADQHDGFVGPFALGPPLGAALCLLAVPAAVVTVAVGQGATTMLRAVARALLATRLPPGSPVRETLAQSLGDRSLSIAYWLDDRRTFVDDAGRPVTLPEPGSARAWTAVDYDGRRVAAIIHDANLDASPELVQAAAAAASLALDNERLKADLRARVEELRASRMRIVQAGDSARRRLERDLHDGAQQQLVALAVDLKLLRRRLGSDPQVEALIDGIDEKLASALSELRELARGIHPAILTDRGLEPAINSLAERAPLPVLCEVEIDGRAPAPVEAAAYFVVAEALTNVAKYAQASQARVRVSQDGDDILVEVHDDGVGGADDRWGSGLRGLNDRVGALDGTLAVTSPIGAGTLVRARIPCGAGAMVAQATAEPVERRGHRA